MRRTPRRVPPGQRGRAVLALAMLTLPLAAAAWLAVPQGVQGRVTDGAGRPVANAQVAPADPLQLRPLHAVTDSYGRYRLGAHGWPLSPSVLVSAPGFAPARSNGGDLVLHRWPRITGRAVDDMGQPVAGATVTLSRGRQLWSARTDGAGQFSVVAAGATGSAWLAVQSEHHEPAYGRPRLALDRVVTFALSLPRLLGTVHVDSDPTGQTPSVDGRAVPDCPSTPCELGLSIGPHHLEFNPDLYVPWAQDVQVDRGASVTVTAKLERKTGTLTVTIPLAGELTVDGKAVGNGGWSGPVPTGKHTISFRSPSTWPASATADVAWKQTATTTLTPAPVAPGDAGAFGQNLQGYLTAAGGSYGVYIEDLKSGGTLGAGQDQRMEAASVIKVPLALYLLHQVDANQVKLDDKIDLHQEDFMGGTGTLISTAHTGDKFAVQDLLALLIQQSDNTAWQALDRVLKASAVDAYAASIGAGDCHQGSDSCTPREAGLMVGQLAQGKLLSPASTQRLLSLLESTVFNDRINYYLPGVPVAHKVGMDGGVINDCGVAFLPDDPIAICVFTNTSDPNLGVQVIRDVTRAAVHYYGH